MSATDEIAAIAAEHGLSPDHPADVLAEAAACRADTEDPQLRDLRELPFVTIDEPSSMDLDQALFVEPDGAGWVVWYAIADAAHQVRPGTALHREALRRGATYYLPGLVIRMLPASLSEGLISLLPDVDRRAVVFRMRVGATGASEGCDIVRARIRSRLKTSYRDVQAWVDGGPAPSEDPAVMAGLVAFGGVGEARLRDAEGRGVVRVRRVEVSVDLDDTGARFVALRDLRRRVELWNEQISLLANSEGAEFLARRAGDPRVQPIYRVMEPPGRAQLAGLAERIAAIARAHGRGDAWIWDPDGAPLADWLDALPDDPVAQAIHRQVMLVGGRAAFVPEPLPHAGVGAEVYARFTAPMREIVGIYLHAELMQLLEGTPDPVRDAADAALRPEVIAAAGRSRNLQRDLDHACNERVLDQLFADDLRTGRARPATVMGFSRDKVHLLLDDPPIDVKWYFVHIEQTHGVRPRVSDDGVTLYAGDRTVVRLGDTVTVRVVRFDDTKRRWELAVG